MSRIRSRSLMISEEKDPLLKEHIEKLAEQSQEYIRLKLKYQQQKQARINAVEKNFIEWANKKENQIQHKLQKSAKNKEEHINQIVKKCKQHDKYLAQRLKNYKDKKKTHLRQAWVQSQKYNSKIDQSHNLESDAKGKPLKYSNQLQLMSKSRAKSKMKSQNKEDMGIMQKDNYSHNKQFRIREKHYLTLPDENMQVKETVNQKLEKKWARFQQNNLDLQRLKIQELGQRLQKIQQGRMKKIDLIKSKKQKHKTTGIHRPNEDTKQQRISSQRGNYQSTVRETRVRDRSQTYKDRREQSFEMQLQNGNQYVSNSKIKYLKTKIAKKIEMSAIQKMLYLERLSH